MEKGWVCQPTPRATFPWYCVSLHSAAQADSCIDMVDVFDAPIAETLLWNTTEVSKTIEPLSQ